jgi:RNA recognition motif-containing protein
MGKKLYVGNLSYAVDSGSLQDLFSQYGNVESANVITDRETGRSKGFGFVEMGSDDEANEAINKLNGQEMSGRQINVSEAKPQAPRTGGGGGGGRGGFGGGRGGGGGFGGGRSGGGGRDRY